MNILIEEIKNRLLRIIEQSTLQQNIMAAFLYGGNTEYLKLGLPMRSHEVDLLIVVNRSLLPGEAPIPKEIMENLTKGLKHNQKSFSLIYNGIAPQSYTGEQYLLDIIGDGITNIQEKDPSAVIVSYKSRILLYGSDVYSRLSNVKFTNAMRDDMIKIMVKYVRREFYSRQDLYAIRALAKNCIFISSLFSENTLRLNDKEKIVENISFLYPSLNAFLSYFLEAYHFPHNTKKEKLNNNFNEFCIILNTLS